MKSKMSKKWVAPLFAKLQMRYGRKWTSNFPTRELVALGIDEWSIVLGGLDAEDIRCGLDSWKGDWPPGAVEFRKACERPDKIKSHQLYRALPRPKADPNIVRTSFSKMRAFLA
jgi:hypothetical protein